MRDHVAMYSNSQAVWPFRHLAGKGPKIALAACLAVAATLAIWQYQRTDLHAPGETVSIGLTSKELIALRKLIRPTTANSNRAGTTQLSIAQIRDLEERLAALEKAVPMSDSLSAAANNDLRLLQRDIDALKDQQIFQGQMIKDQTAELRDEVKMWMGIMVTVNLAVLAWKVKSG
jgi:hypothetical protein